MKIFAVVIVVFDIINVTLFTIDMVIKLKKVPNLCQHCTYHNTRSLMVLQSENETLLFFQSKIVFFCVFFFKKNKIVFVLTMQVILKTQLSETYQKV